MNSNWPSITDGYNDEFGWVDPDIYGTAGELWNEWGKSFALSTIHDEMAGQRLMLKAASLVTRRRAAPDAKIENVLAYLHRTYQHLVLAELEKESGHRRSESDTFNDNLLTLTKGSVPDDLERRILIQQLMRRMDEWTRETFQLLVLGYSFEMIAQLTNKKSNVLRSKFSKQVKQLIAEINPQMPLFKE
jgi:hypothetical protein